MVLQKSWYRNVSQKCNGNAFGIYRALDMTQWGHMTSSLQKWLECHWMPLIDIECQCHWMITCCFQTLLKTSTLKWGKCLNHCMQHLLNKHGKSHDLRAHETSWELQLIRKTPIKILETWINIYLAENWNVNTTTDCQICSAADKFMGFNYLQSKK